MSATLDPTDQYRFATKEEAIEYGEMRGVAYIIVIMSGPEYADKTFMYVAQSWLTKCTVIRGNDDEKE